MPNLSNLRRHIWLLRKFSNGTSLVGNLRAGGMLSSGPPMTEVVFRDGTRILHPANRSGLIGTLLEIWYQNVYRIGEFYSPKKGDVIVDIGAHVGFFATFVARKKMDCKVICIEASKENFKCLEENIKSFENITTYNLALGSNHGWIKTVIDTNRSIDARVVQVDDEEPDSTELLPVNELYKLTKSQKINLMKMDIEGAEFEIFKVIDDSMIASIEKLSMEYHDNLKPGTLKLLENRLRATHDVEVFPDGDTGHGMLFASLK